MNNTYAHKQTKMTSNCGHFLPVKKAYFLHNKMFKFLNIYKNIGFKRTTKGPILSDNKCSYFVHNCMF